MKDEKFLSDQLSKLLEIDDADGDAKGNDGKTLKDALKEIADECKTVSEPDQ